MSDDFHKHVKNSWHPPSPAPKSASLLIFPLLFSLPGQKICHHLWSSLSLTSQLQSISLFSVPQPLLKIYVRWCHSSTQNSTPSPHLLHSKNQSAYNSLTWSLLLSTSFPTALSCLLNFSHTDHTVVPQTCQKCSLLKIFHWLSLLPRKFLPQESIWLSLSSLSLFLLNYFSVRPSSGLPLLQFSLPLILLHI